jgi:hypothetical protein
MIQAKCREALELLLRATYAGGRHQRRHSFSVGPPGASHWEKRFGAEVSYDWKGLVAASLYVRQNGPLYLRYIPVNDIAGMLVKFLAENYWHVL